MFSEHTTDSGKAEKIVLKIGGSIITKKDVNEFPLEISEIKEKADDYIKYDVIRRIGKEIKEVLKEKNIQLILVNGAGPFGHFLVKHDRPDNEVRWSVKYLNEKLVSEFRKTGLDTVSVVPSESCEFVNGEFNVSRLWKSTNAIIKKDKIPSTYGDVLNNGKIISGDDLVVLLAKQWRADKIIAATDVDGVFTKNPHIHKDAELIKALNIDDNSIGYTKIKIDVTGEMASKVKKLKQAAIDGIKCQIINGAKEGNIKAVLLGDESIGTLILC